MTLQKPHIPLSLKAISKLCLTTILVICGVGVPNALHAQPSKTLVIAHRGGKNLAPENTMVAFRNADSIGADVLEMDIRLSRDSVLVCHHDATINRCSDGIGSIAEKTYAQLATYNFGYHFRDFKNELTFRDKKVRIPTTREVLKSFPKRTFMIEVKESGERGKLAADSLIYLIERFNLHERVILGSFHDEICAYLKSTDNSLNVCAGKKAITRFVLSKKLGLGFLTRTQYDALPLPMKSMGMRLYRKSLIRTAKKKNYDLYYWTVNDIESMRKLLANGVDGIITDRPDQLLSILSRKK